MVSTAWAARNSAGGRVVPVVGRVVVPVDGVALVSGGSGDVGPAGSDGSGVLGNGSVVAPLEPPAAAGVRSTALGSEPEQADSATASRTPADSVVMDPVNTAPYPRT